MIIECAWDEHTGNTYSNYCNKHRSTNWSLLHKNTSYHGMVASNWESMLLTIKARYGLTILGPTFYEQFLASRIPKIKSQKYYNMSIDDN